MPPKRIEEER